MDDVVLMVLTGAVGGASGNLISNYVDRSVFWLRDKFQNHNEIAQRNAAENSLEYLKQLGEKVQELEERSTKDHLTLNQALEEPDTSLLLQKSLLVASTTSNPLKHALLSDLILKRLESNAEDYSSLIANQACEVIGSLSSDQIKMLSILAGIYYMRPDIDQIIESKIDYEIIVTNYVDKVCKEIDSINDNNNLLFQHLEGMSCISMGIGSYDLFTIINSKVKSNNFKITEENFKDFRWWPKFMDVWDENMKFTRLTSIGIFIGSLANGIVTKTNVKLSL